MTLKGRYWDSSWVFLFEVGAGVEYRLEKWGIGLEVSPRYLGKPESALAPPSDATSSWTIPVRLGLVTIFKIDNGGIENGEKAFGKAAIFTVLIFFLLQTAARADDLKTGQRPGKNDPLTRTTLIQDDELLMLAGYHGDYGTGLIEYYLYPDTGVDMEHWYQSWFGGDDEFQWFTTDFAASSKFRHMAAAAGRLNDPDKAGYGGIRCLQTGRESAGRRAGC